MSGLRMGTVTPGRKRARRKRGEIIRRGVNHTHQSTTELQTSTSCVVYCLNMMFLDGIWRHATPAPPPTRSHLSPNPTITIIASFTVSVHTSIPKQLPPSPLPLFTPSSTTATLFITTCPSLKSLGSNRSRTLLHVLL